MRYAAWTGLAITVILLGSLTYTTLLPSAASQPGQPDQLKALRDELTSLKQTVTELRKDIRTQETRVSWLSRTSPPVGSVVAFAGPWPPKDSKGNVLSEAETGWLLCDGRAIKQDEYPELYTLLDKLYDPEKMQHKLPNYQGQFLRGLDTTGQKDKGDLVSANQRKSRVLGSSQGDLTALPKEAKFKTGHQSENPNYRRLTWIHSFVFVTGRGEAASFFRGGSNDEKNQWDKGFKTEGNHTHDVTDGGDPETRPINVAVHWIIKAR